jgi:hypothetical protein
MSTVVYLQSDTPEGYIWESVEDGAIPLFIERGWFLSPADFPEPESVKPEKAKKVSKPKVKKDLQDIVADL